MHSERTEHVLGFAKTVTTTVINAVNGLAGSVSLTEYEVGTIIGIVCESLAKSYLTTTQDKQQLDRWLLTLLEGLSIATNRKILVLQKDEKSPGETDA